MKYTHTHNITNPKKRKRKRNTIVHCASRCDDVVCQSKKYVKVKLAENQFSMTTFSIEIEIYPFNFMEIFIVHFVFIYEEEKWY